MIPQWEVRPAAKPGGFRRGVLLLVLVALAAGFAGGFYLSSHLEQGSETQRELLRRLSDQAQELERLRSRYAVVASSDQVGREVEEQSRRTIQLLEEQVFELQQDLAFYKGVVAPASRREGLRIRSMQVTPGSQEGRFQYQILLSRVGKDEKPVTGDLVVMLVGHRAGKPLQVPLNDDGAPLRFAFKHFQALPEAGRYQEFGLPEDFVPERLMVSAKVAGSDVPVEQSFDWPEMESSDVQER